MQILTIFIVWLAAPIIILLSATAGGKKNIQTQSITTLFALLWASFFAAVRFQTGDDWHAYELYYDTINTNMGLIESYFSDLLMLQFEPGYYFISYLTKSFGASYTAVNYISVLALLFAIIYFVRKAAIPPYFVVFIFLGLPFLSLFYNQVRQSFAIALVLLAILSRRNTSFMALSCFALVFHFSTAIFIALAFLARHHELFSRKIFRLAIIFIPISFTLVTLGAIEPYSILRFILPETLSFKVEIYEGEETPLGAFRIITISYLIFVAIFLSVKFNKYHSPSTLERRVITTALLTTLLAPYSLIAFPNSYAFYGRALVFNLIILSISGAILHKHTVHNNQRRSDLTPIYGLGALSFIYYFLTLYLYSDVYLLYRSVFFQ